MRAAGVCEEGRITQLWDCRGGIPRGPCRVKPLHLSDLEGKGNGRTDWDLIRVPSKTRAAIVPKSTMSWISRVALILLFSGETRGHSTLFTGYDLSLTGYHLCPQTVTKTVSKVVAHQTTHTERSSCGGWLPWKNCLKTHYKTVYRIVETKIIKHSPGCCDGYEQVGSYCALPLNRAEEFTSKPGTCPEHKIAVNNQSCEWDIHCPGLQKCCRVNGTALCVSPVCAVAEGRWFYNATVTVKMDFAELNSLDKGLLNHSRLLHSVVTGALASLDSSVYYIQSYRAGNFKTASQLLIKTSSRVSQENISSELELIVRNIEEVCHVEVQDVDGCSLCFSAEGSYDCVCGPGFINTTLDRNGRECTADLNTGTVSSNSSTLQENTTAPASWTQRNATGLPDFTAVTESSTTDEARNSNATHPPPTRAVEPFSNTTAVPPATSTIPTQRQSSVAADLTAIAATSQLNSTVYTHSIAEEGITSAQQPVSCALGGALCSALSTISTTPGDWMLNSTATPNPTVATSPHLMQSTATGFDSTNSTFLNVTKVSTDSPHTNPSWTTTALPATTSSPDLSMWSSAIPLPLATTAACYPSPVKNLVVVNVTSLGFYVSWSVDDSPFNPSFEVKLLQGAVQLESAETREPGWAAAGLEAGQLYTVWVTVKLCGSESVAKQEVRTAAEVLEGTARITNLQFNEALSNSSSEEYLNLTQEIQMEIRKSLPEDTLALLSSGEVRLVITSVSSGSVKVHFLLVFTAALHDRIESLSSALLTSLQNSSSYVVDSSSTSIVDFDECSAGEDDCSPHASCVNTWGSYNCCCRDTFRDINPSRPGRSCHDIDECESGNTTCHMNAACQNTIGGYSCSCHNGFSDTDPRNPGRHCADINECASDNNTCHPNSTCHNFPGGYSCACNSGFNDTDPGYPGRQCAVLMSGSTPAPSPSLSETPALRETQDTQGSTTVIPLSETPALRETQDTQGSTTVIPLSETPALRETQHTQGSTTVIPLSETPALRETQDTQGSTTVIPLPETPALRETQDTQGSTTVMPLSETPALRETQDTQGSTTVIPLPETPALRETQDTQGSTTVIPLPETPALRETQDTQGSTTVIPLPETPALRETQDTQGSTTVMPLSETPALRETQDTQGSTTVIPLSETPALRETQDTQGSTTVIPLSETPALRETQHTQGSTTVIPLSETPALRETQDTQGSTTVIPLSETPALRETQDTQGSTTVIPLSETPALRETQHTQGSTTVMPLSETPALRETQDTQGSTTVIPLPETPALRETHDTQGSTTVIPLAEAITVSCRAPHITVSVKKAFLSWKSIAESSLYLGTAECNASSSNETHVWLSAVWGKCATQLLHNTSHMTVQTTLFNTHASNITLLPETVIKLPVRCTYSNDFLISTGYTPSEIENLKGVIEGSGSFLATIQLLNGTVPLPKNYSLSPNDDVLIEVGVNLDSLQVKIILHECWATPSISSTDPTTYMFISNSCPVPNTYTTVLENGNSTRARVSLRVFSFVDQSVIYLHCRVRVCLESAGTSCKSNCNVRSSGSSAHIEIGQAMWGPIYKSSTDTTQNPSSPYNETGFILLGVFLCALLAVVLAVLTSLHRKRVGHYDFSIKPRQENFTYQVFDT